MKRIRLPKIAIAQSQGSEPGRQNPRGEREVVVTLALKVEAEDAFSETVAGTEHTAPVGAPVQVNEAVPLIPEPPMESA